MPVFLQDVEDRRSTTGIIPLDLAKVPATLNVRRWNDQSQKYLSYWDAFTGRIWEEVMPNGTDPEGRPVLRYPLQINYIKTTCMKHSYILFGEVSDNPEPLVPARVTPKRVRNKKVSEEKRTQAYELEDFINDVWNDNNGRALQQENGLVQQFLGGCVFKLSWHPEDKDLQYGIKIETILPDFFLPVWETGNPDNLLEAFIIYRMPAREADILFNHKTVNSLNPIYIEHWTKDKITITLDGEPVKYTVDGETFVYDDLDNPWGFIPLVYIPRERAGSYYGLSLVDDLLGMAKELNAKLAYMGDIVQNTADPNWFTVNMQRKPTPITIGKRINATDLGGRTPGSDADPKAWVESPPPLQEALTKYPQLIKEQYARDAYIPGVADGEDEGSQRSALTLAFRMWPVTSKIRTVRTYWTVGMNRLNTMIAKMAIMKKVGGITEEHLKEMRFACRWNPMIPRDNEQELNTVTIAKQSEMLSPVTGIAKLNLVDDPDEEYEKVMEHAQRMATIQASLKAAGGASGSGSSGPSITTKKQQVSTVMKEPGES